MTYAFSYVTAALLLVLPAAAPVSGENQLIDDFWMREKAPSRAQPAAPAETPRRNKNQLIDDYWMREKSPSQAKPARPAKETHAEPARGAQTPSLPPPSGMASQPEQPATLDTPAPAVQPAATVGTTESAEANAPAPVSVPASPPTDGRIRPDDRISVQVHQVDELSVTGVVTSAGRIEIPLIGPVEVAGLTVEQAEARIEEALGRDYLQDPRVKVQFQGQGVSEESQPEGASSPEAAAATVNPGHTRRELR